MDFLRSPIVLDDKDRAELCTNLGLALADGLALRLCVKLAHWNVMGHAFIKLHVLFDEGAEMLDGSTDRIAERIATLGGIVGTNVQCIGDVMRIPDYPTTKPLGAFEHVAEVASRFDKWLAGLKADSDLASRINEPGTVNLLGEVIEETQVYAWKLVKHLEDGGNLPPAPASKDVGVFP